MPEFIPEPTVLNAAGTPPKRIEEFIGQLNTGDEDISIARMVSPAGWSEPGQRPEFVEMTVVFEGMLRIETENDGVFEVRAGQAVKTASGEWVRYSTPEAEGAVYLAICLPAFSPTAVHRDSG